MALLFLRLARQAGSGVGNRACRVIERAGQIQGEALRALDRDDLQNLWVKLQERLDAANHLFAGVHDDIQLQLVSDLN